MPRTVLKVRTPDQLDEADATAMEGFPGDGEEYNEDEVREGEEGEGEAEPVQRQQAPQYVSKSDFDNLQAQLAATQAMIVQNRGEPAARGPVQQQVAEDDTDYGQLFFDNPNEAVKKIKASVKREIEGDLTQKYTADTGKRNFWDRFYRAHPDLEAEADLVENTLNSNMGSLGGQAIPKAIEGLASLTRARIAGYVERANKGRGKKALVEGAGAVLPNSARPKPQQEQSYSLSDSIRKRRAKRAGAA